MTVYSKGKPLFIKISKDEVKTCGWDLSSTDVVMLYISHKLDCYDFEYDSFERVDGNIAIEGRIVKETEYEY